MNKIKLYELKRIHNRFLEIRLNKINHNILHIHLLFIFSLKFKLWCQKALNISFTTTKEKIIIKIIIYI
jgi:hypothetical protein